MCLWSLILIVHVSSRIFLHCVCVFECWCEWKIIECCSWSGCVKRHQGVRRRLSASTAERQITPTWEKEREMDTGESCRHNRIQECLNTAKHFPKKQSWMDAAENITSVRSRTALCYTAVGSWECLGLVAEGLVSQSLHVRLVLWWLKRLFSATLLEIKGVFTAKNCFWEHFSQQFLKEPLFSSCEEHFNNRMNRFLL